MTAVELADLIHRLPPWGVVLLVVVNLLTSLWGTAAATTASAKGVYRATRWYCRARSARADRLALMRVRERHLKG